MIVIDLACMKSSCPPRARIDPYSFFIHAITSRVRITSIIYRDRVD